MFKAALEGLCGDLFEGSDQEKQILSKILFGEDAGDRADRVGNFPLATQYEGQKNGVRLSEQEGAESAITWQSCLRSLLTDDTGTNGIVGSVPAYSSEGFSLTGRGDQNEFVKRMKLSNETSYTGPAIIDSMPSLLVPRNLDNILTNAARVKEAQSLGSTAIESSSEGLGSSCYVVESNLGMQKVVEKCDSGILNSSLHDSITNVAVASSASQESIATWLLHGNHPVAVVENYESSPFDEKRPQETDLKGLDGLSNLKTDPKRDPRAILQNHVMRLLLQAGWSIEKRKRPCRKYMENFYRSPSGKLYREFTKVWKACGQIFSAEKYDLVQVDDDREWVGINQFLSELSNVLTTLENEVDRSDNMNTLVHIWLQLDPFVNVVYINKKIGCLRKEGSVRVIRTMFVEKKDKTEIVVAVESNHGLGSEATQSSLLSFNGDPYTSIHGELSICGGNYQACDALSGNRSLSEYGEPLMPSIHWQASLSVSDGTANQSCGMNEDKLSFLEMMCLPSGDASGAILSGWRNEMATNDVDINGRRGCESVSPHQDSNLVGVNDLIDFSMIQEEQHCAGCFTSGLSEQAVFNNAGEQYGLKFNVKNRKKIRRKSKKISDIRSATFYQDNDASDDQVESNKANFHHSENAIFEKSTTKLSIHRDKTKKGHYTGEESKKGQNKKGRCLIGDDDLLVSAIFRNKDVGHQTSRSTFKKKTQKSNAKTKLKGRKGGCRLLLRNLGYMGKHHMDGTWWRDGARTVLSWLINAGTISVNDVIQYRRPKDDVVVKDGLITHDGVLCRCCNMVLSVSGFKNHAALKPSRQSLNLFMESGEPFSLCQLQAWSAEYKARKTGPVVFKVEQEDQNDDSCGICGDGGELICCDNCPSTFHQTCLSKEDLPEGSWYCSYCTCRVCGDFVNAKEALDSAVGLKCSQCEHKYHVACMKGGNSCEGVVLDAWFCSGSCQEVYTGLQSHVGICNYASDGYCWTLLKCIQEDQKVHSAQRLALKAECNSKLTVALTIMEECFQPMVDSRTGISMIPQVIYNWGSEFARLDFHGFYTMVLEKDDILVAAASISDGFCQQLASGELLSCNSCGLCRVHGVNVAEMPLIATCSKYRRQGMCRRLMSAIEEMLISFKVEKLVISAIPDLVDTWKVGFGFTAVNDHEKESLNDINFMVFPGTIMLKKVLCVKEVALLETDVECSGHVPGESTTACERKETDDIGKSEDDSALERHREPFIVTADKQLGGCPPSEVFAVSTQQADAKPETDLLQNDDCQDPKTSVDVVKANGKKEDLQPASQEYSDVGTSVVVSIVSSSYSPAQDDGAPPT